MYLKPVITLLFTAVAATSQIAVAATLDGMLPRGRTVCYGGPETPGPAFSRVRVTRPERLQSYDEARSRVVRLVINFAGSAGARLEDTASCRDNDGEIVCASTTCDGAIFVLGEDGNGAPFVKFDIVVPRAMWSCRDPALRPIEVDDRHRSVPVTRATGSCINDE